MGVRVWGSGRVCGLGLGFRDFESGAYSHIGLWSQGVSVLQSLLQRARMFSEVGSAKRRNESAAS